MKRLLLAAALALLAAPAMAQLVEPNGTYAGPPIVPEASCRKPDCFFPVWKNLFPDDGSVDQGALWQAAMGSSSSPATTIPLGAPSPVDSVTFTVAGPCTVTIGSDGTVKRTGCKDADDAARTFWKAAELVGMKLACTQPKDEPAKKP